jgi:hypothetical protein
LLDSDQSRLRAAIAASTGFIVAAFCTAYVLWDPDGLPFGYDSSSYVAEAQLVASHGPVALFALQGPYNFLYQLFSGLIVWIGAPAMDVEIVLPVILAASLPCLLSRLALIHLGARTAALVALTTPAWYGVYRIAADLHANLLAVTLCIASIILLSKSSSIRQQRCIAGLGLLGLASITHIESTLLFASVFVVSSLSPLRQYQPRVACAVVATIIPATILYAVDFQRILAFTGGTYDFSPTVMTGSSWITYLGPLLPLAILGLTPLLVRRVSWLEALVVVWGVASVVIGLSQYGSPELINLARRAVVLTPIPFLVPFGIRILLYFVEKLRTSPLRIQQFGRVLVATIVILLALSWPLVYGVAAQQNLSVSITTPQYQQLLWVKANVKSAAVPIFMFNDYDEFAGGLARLYDSWVSVVVGNHLSYLGLTDYLVQLQETPFSDPTARATSTTFLQQIRESGVDNKTELLQHRIIILSEFYRPIPLPRYTSSLFVEVTPGVFIDKPASLQGLANVTIPLFISDRGHTGPWTGVPEPWTESLDAYEVYVDKAPIYVQATFYLNIGSTGTYSLSLRYWDQSGNNLTITLDTSTLGTIFYNNSKTPIFRSFDKIALTAGTHTFSIKIDQAPYPLRWASLDYLTVSES